MRWRTRGGVAACIAALALCAPGHAQEPRSNPPDVVKVRGRIVNAETGEPLRGVHIEIPALFVRAKTDAEGRYSLDVPAGSGLVSVESYLAGYYPERQAASLSCGHGIRTSPDQFRCEKSVDFHLRAAHQVYGGTHSRCDLRGRVLVAPGQPAVSAALELRGTELGTLVDAAGEFKIGSVPSGLYALRVRQIGYAWLDTVVIVTCSDDSKSSPLTLWLSPDEVRL